jgi:DNA modification methylase
MSTTPLRFLDGRAVLYPGDCMDVIKALDDNSIDACITDAPYALVSIVKRFGKTSQADNTQTSDRSRKGADGYTRLAKGFMGKEWDNGATAFAIEFWVEVLRVLKPGAHVIAFGGTRSYHRLACAIEDAGFEIRDMLSWNYGSGFPKSHNIGKSLDAKKERCSCGSDLRGLRQKLDAQKPFSGDQEQDMRPYVCGSNDWDLEQRTAGRAVNSMRDLREDGASASVSSQEERGDVLQSVLPQQEFCRPSSPLCGEWTGDQTTGERFNRNPQPGLEGRSDLPQETGQLRECEIRSLPAGIYPDVASGRLRDGASARDGKMDRPPADAGGMRSSQRSCAAEQSKVEPGALARQSKPQERGAWDYCERCGKPIIPDGIGTALKPAHEPICLARKPLSEGTVAANVLRWGTGAINVDATRIETDDRLLVKGNSSESGISKGIYGSQSSRDTKMGAGQSLGRWPANICHDGSAEVLAAFPDSAGQQGKTSGRKPSDAAGQNGIYGRMARVEGGDPRADSGSASRFFYSAKADADDRLGSKHPTVKPVDLMQWLCRLVTPPGGTILDPFAGTGTTGEAAWRECFNAVLIEREAEYCADIARRMALCVEGPLVRAHESIKARNAGKSVDHGPLFGGTGCVGGANTTATIASSSSDQPNYRTNRIEKVES